MSKNLLEEVRKLIVGTQQNTEIAIVVEVIDDNVAVDASGKRVIIKGNFTVGEKIIISGSTFIRKSEAKTVTFFTE